MNHLPENTRLGKLEPLDVYSEYDAQPCLFSCQNEDREIYLALWVDKTDDCSRWLYTALSLTRLKWLKEGAIDIRSAFTEAASGFVYDVKADKNGAIAKMLSCSALTDDLLPVAGEFLRFD